MSEQEPAETTHFRHLFNEQREVSNKLRIRVGALEAGISSVLTLLNGDYDDSMKAVRTLLDQTLAAAREKSQ
jgi:hypothetical protein